MSIEVALDGLAEAVAARRDLAHLVTIRADGGEPRPHVVAVHPSPGEAGTLLVRAGRRTAANVGRHPQVTLLWPPDAGDPTHSLLVDATAAPTPDGASLVLHPTSAILHRVRAAR